MKNLTCLLTILLIAHLLPSQNTFAVQQKPTKPGHVKSKVARNTFKDSVSLVNIVTFDKSPYSVTNNKPNYANVIKFTLSITNGSKAAIPDPVSFKGAKYVKLYINGHLNNPKMLYDDSRDAGDGDNLITPGASQVFHCDWLTSKYASIQKKYGKKYIVQWSYLNIMSKKVAVDMTKRTATLVK
ncbi:hypothetical protein KXQ82_08995 [Mucilaginibacter sp. HMF5004]|uniref:hypothetical protein n=1 Tax=Mucilaginibacter rivuli TaxID=2857527 RepID=UPI001C5D81C1|nr:hypothetical protein [Mucilaginibacter rivuli]MBW4889851.1 hypothetical protein [Mucilaginibacter rivuli]